MSRRVFVHIGLPKTGTSYLQAICWPARDALLDAGLLLPGARKNDHLFSSMIVRDDPGVQRRGPDAGEAWERVRADVAAFEGDSLISHEFFCSATAEQARRMADQLAPAEVHLVITTREPLGLFTSSWQESLKNKATTPLADYGHGESDDPRDVWDWRALDLGRVLQRWSRVVTPERLHVIAPSPPDAPRTVLWERFCGVLGLDPSVADASRGFANSSMGVVEAETLRRVNAVLPGFDARSRGRWIRTHLADQRLVPRDGEPFWPGADQVAECRRRGARAVALLGVAPYDIVGDTSLLLVPDDLPQRRHPDSVTDAEVAACAVDLVANLLGDLRDAEERAADDTPPRPEPEHASRGFRLRRAARGRPPGG